VSRWTDDWKQWTWATYSLVHAVAIAEKLSLGNAHAIEQSFRDAEGWTSSQLGFSPVAEKRKLDSGSIEVSQDQVPEILDTLRIGTLTALLTGTASVVEVLLGDILEEGAGKRPGDFFRLLKAAERITPRLGRVGSLRWAMVSLHELRVLRNCVVHARAQWSDKAIDDLRRFTRVAATPGTTVIIGIDDILRYRRASRAVLNAVAQACGVAS
jgi:hypothetical protein